MDTGTVSGLGVSLPRAGEAALWYYDHFILPLPQRHRYPRSRFALVRERLAEEARLAALRQFPAQPADWSMLRLVHTPSYLDAVREGTLSPQAIREIGLPLSPGLLERARAAVHATVQAARWALASGIGGVVGGGTHHAFADRGAGYCLFNDIAVAVRVLQRGHAVERIVIVDLDVHQGNGNAEIFRREERVFTFSVHGERNWPYRKSASDLDVGLPDGTGDEAYLETLAVHLESVLDRFRPELVFYQAGVDPLASDRLGRLALTHEGLRRRDRLVLSACEARHCPVVVTMGGGYGVPMEQSVEAHVNTLRELARLWPGRPAASATGSAV